MNEEENKKVNERSPIMRQVINLLNATIADIKDGKCSEEELTDALFKFNPELRGYFKDGDFVNYDEVGNILGLGWNRNKINELCKKHGIKNVKICNCRLGFPRKEIIKLKDLLK